MASDGGRWDVLQEEALRERARQERIGSASALRRAAPLSPEERIARARAALAHAELRTGARSLRVERTDRAPEPRAVAPVPSVPSVPAVPSMPSGRSAGPAADPSAERAVGVVRWTSLLTTERPPLPVPGALAMLLPDGLRRGGTAVVTGSTSLVLAVLAAAGSGGAWAAAVGQPGIGLLAAAQAGVALDRFAVVPRPGLETPTVLAALLDGVDVVLVGPEAVLTDGDRRRLTSRARERGSVLLSTAPWPGAGCVLTAEHGRWTGVGSGEGRLRTHELRVTRTGRGSAALARSVDLTLPLAGGAGSAWLPGSVVPGSVPVPVHVPVPVPVGPPLRLVG